MDRFTATQEQMLALSRAIMLVQESRRGFESLTPYARIAWQAAHKDAAELFALGRSICPHPDERFVTRTPDDREGALPPYQCNLCDGTWKVDPRHPGPALEPESELAFCDAMDGTRKCYLLSGHQGVHGFVQPPPIEEIPF